MARPAITFNGHFDGNVIIPDQPLELPKDAEVRVRLEVVNRTSKRKMETQLERFDKLAGSIRGVSLPDTAYDHDSLYKQP